VTISPPAPKLYSKLHLVFGGRGEMDMLRFAGSACAARSNLKSALFEVSY